MKIWKTLTATAVGMTFLAGSALAQECKPSKWGADDEIGSANLVTPERTLEATKLIKQGKSVPLGIVIDSQTPAFPPRGLSLQVVQPNQQGGQKLFAFNGNYNDDLMQLWLGIGSQIDGLGHLGENGLYYNCLDEKEISQITGLTKLGTHNIPPLVGRGVVIDMAKHFGVEALESGFAFLPVLVGLFAFSQLMSDVADRDGARNRLMDAGTQSVRVDHLGAIKAIVKNWAHLIRSSLIGAFTGILPAAGGSISNILAYDQAKKADKNPESFGTGTPAGIVASESANNATAGGALITMMALGIPGDIVTAVMLGALLIHDVVPSPSFIGDQPKLAYGIFIAFFFANFLMLAVQSVALKGFLVVTKARMYMLAAIILCFCAIGVFALHNSVFDIWTLFIFGILGFSMRLLGFPLAPMILGVVLGPIAEVWLNRAVSSNADPMLYFTRPWSLFFIIVAVFSVIFPYYQKAKRRGEDWTRWFLPALCLFLSVPLFMMEGTVRPILGGVIILGGIWLFVKNRNGEAAAG